MKSYGGTTPDWYPRTETRRPTFWVVAAVFVIAGVLGWCLVQYATYGAVLPSWQEKMAVEWQDRYGPFTGQEQALVLSATEWTCGAFEHGTPVTAVIEGHAANGFTDAQSATLLAGAVVLVCPQFDYLLG